MKHVLLLLTVLVSAIPLQATVWQVGVSRQYTMPSQVSSLVKNNDTVEIDAGIQQAQDEMTVVAGLMQAHIKKNASIAQSQADYATETERIEKRYNDALERYTSLEDVAHAYVLADLDTTAGAALVHHPSQLATTREFVEVIERVMPGAASRIQIDGPSIPSNIPPKPHYISELYPDWHATPLEEGVRKTIEFYRKPN